MPLAPCMASSSQASSKRSRTAENSRIFHSLLHHKGISLTALKEIFNKLVDDDDKFTEDFARKVNREHLDEVARVIELPLEDGGSFAWEVANPSLLISLVLRKSSEMESAFYRALSEHPCSAEKPWNLVVVFDEFTPGTMLKPHNERKTMVVNCTFLELHPEVSDNLWFTIAVSRSTMIKKVIGGWSRMLRDLLRLSLFGASGLQTVGAPVMVNGLAGSIYAKLVCLLSDGDGLKQALQWKGASGLKPCFRHWNVVKRDHPMSRRDDGKYVAVDCDNVSRFKLWNEADLRDSIDVCVEAHRLVASGDLSRNKCNDTFKALGFTATEHGLLADEQLRQRLTFMDIIRYDWAHSFLADSMVGKEMWELIAAATTHGLFSQEDLHAFLDEPWQFSGKKGQKATKWNQLKLVFNEWRSETNESHNAVKAGMSELLGLYSLLRHFVEVRVRDITKIRREVEIFLLTCQAIDILLAAKKRRVTVKEAGAELLGTLQVHMRLRTEHFGSRNITPKFHWAFDIAECMMADGFLVDAFALERVHLRVKAVANHIKNTRSYESSLLAGATTSHLNNCSDKEGWASGEVLVGKLTTVREAPGIIAAETATYFGETFAVGTMVCRGEELGVVRACLRDANDCALIVQKVQVVSKLSSHSFKYTMGDATNCVWRMCEAVNCIAWQQAGEDGVAIIL